MSINKLNLPPLWDFRWLPESAEAAQGMLFFQPQRSVLVQQHHMTAKEKVIVTTAKVFFEKKKQKYFRKTFKPVQAILNLRELNKEMS